MTAADAHRAILAVWRIEQPRLITSLARMLRDVPLAEELTQEALLAALERWPATGVPERPGAWLMATAKRRALDHLRRGRMLERKHEMVAWDLEAEQQAMPDLDSALDDDIGDELLRLIFTACHPRLSREARAALALRMICGLTTEEIARAFLLPEATIAQRIVRAKRTLSESGLAYETPRGEELSERLSSVLEVVYLIFNEGYTAARGEDWLRPQLCNEALRMGRVLTSIAPHEPEAHGLLALMELNASRTAARTDAAGEPILMLDQNRALWDQLQIRRGMQALGRARELGGAGGFYALQAAIVACHAQARTASDTDWSRIAGLYAELAAVVRSPDHRAQPRGRRRHGRGSGSGAGDRGRACATSRRSKPITCCRAFAATCSTSSAATRRRAPRSRRPRRWRATGANRICSGGAPPRRPPPRCHPVPARDASDLTNHPSISFSAFRLTQPSLPTMMWSCTEIPSVRAISMIDCVIWMSARDGVGSPDG